MIQEAAKTPKRDPEKPGADQFPRPCLLIPIFENRDTIIRVLDDVAGFGLHCLLVNDGSGKETRAVLAEQAACRDWLEVLHHERNRGKGAAVVTGLLRARDLGFTHALQIDADGQHEAADIPRFLAAAETDPDALILGDPIFDESVPSARIYGRQLSRVWVWIETLSFAVRDPLFGFRVYPVEASVRLVRKKRLGTRMDFDPEIAVRLYWDGVPIRNVKTPVKYPLGGLSHFRMFMDNVRISWLHTRLVFGMLPRLYGLIFRRRQ